MSRAGRTGYGRTGLGPRIRLRHVIDWRRRCWSNSELCETGSGTTPASDFVPICQPRMEPRKNFPRASPPRCAQCRLGSPRCLNVSNVYG